MVRMKLPLPRPRPRPFLSPFPPDLSQDTETNLQFDLKQTCFDSDPT